MSSDEETRSGHVSRKDFVFAVGALGAAGALAETPETAGAAATAGPAQKVAATPPARSTAPIAPLGSEPEAYTFFTAPEAAFVEAAIDRLIPSDELGPGAKAAGVAFFIDQQLEAQFGYGAKMYKQGPWGIATPTQGYQLPLVPRDVYRLGIAAANAYCNATYHKTFDQLDGAHQDDVLTALEHSTVAFDAVPASTFFEMLYANTIEGFWADPLYGGNRDKVGWKLVNFPGVAAAYTTLIEKHNVPYRVAPVSIADVEHATGLADDDHVTVHSLARATKGQ